MPEAHRHPLASLVCADVLAMQSAGEAFSEQVVPDTPGTIGAVAEIEALLDLRQQDLIKPSMDARRTIELGMKAGTRNTPHPTGDTASDLVGPSTVHLNRPDIPRLAPPSAIAFNFWAASTTSTRFRASSFCISTVM